MNDIEYELFEKFINLKHLPNPGKEILLTPQYLIN